MFNYRKKKGAALLVAILVGMMVTVFGAVLLDMVSNEIKTQKSTEKRVVARYLAEAGIEHGLYVYATKTTLDLPVGSNYSGTVQTGTLLGSYVVTYLGNRTFQSVGTTPDNKAVKLQAQIDSSGKIINWMEIK